MSNYPERDEKVNDQEFILQESPRTFYAQVPNIIYELRLPPLALALYCYYRRVGSCFKCQKKVSLESGISARTIRELHPHLIKPQELLGGKSLVTIQARKKEDGSKAPNLIIVNDIWRENDAYFNKSLQSAPTAGGVRRQPPVGPAPTADKEYSSPKNTSFEENVNNVSDVSPDGGRKEEQEGNHVDPTPIPENVLVPQALKDMAEWGLSEKDQRMIASRHGAFSIQRACEDAYAFTLNCGDNIKNLAAFITEACRDYDYIIKNNLPASHIWQLRKERKTRKSTRGSQND